MAFRIVVIETAKLGPREYSYRDDDTYGGLPRCRTPVIDLGMEKDDYVFVPFEHFDFLHSEVECIEQVSDAFVDQLFKSAAINAMPAEFRSTMQALNNHIGDGLMPKVAIIRACIRNKKYAEKLEGFNHVECADPIMIWCRGVGDYMVVLVQYYDDSED
jgi:hypothetical protein